LRREFGVPVYYDAGDQPFLTKSRARAASIQRSTAFPVFTASDAVSSVAYKPARPVPKLVLIADDSAIMRGMIRRFLLEERKDLEICAETGDGYETVEAALSLKPELLILDMRMPRLTGVEIAGIIKRALPKSKIILFTMYAETVGKHLALAVGVRAIVQKADGFSSLGWAVNSLLDESAPAMESQSLP
jgi:CheY-like chemotaxis protein